MDAVSSLALAAGLSWASGIRLYATIFLVGVLANLGYIQLPESLAVLSHPYLIGLSGLLLVVEFIADKSPLIDSAWDSIHTFIRIPAGALLAIGAINSADPLVVTSVALLGGTLAGGTHLAKSGGRALINTSPEPVSNWAASFGEDGLVAVGLWLMLAHPVLFLCFLVIFIVGVIWLLPKLWGGLRRTWHHLMGRAGQGGDRLG